MTKKSRLNPNKDSRTILRELEKKHVLCRRKVGLRHVIRTDGSVQYLGYNIGYDWQNRHMPNFYPGADQVNSLVVQYKGERAELTATLGRNTWEGHILDIGTHFPPNPLATQLLLAEPNCGWRSKDPQTAYGDAILTTDNRMHWVLESYKFSIEEVEEVNDLLISPRDLIVSSGRAKVFFHTEPSQNDLIVLKMRWL